MKKKYWFITFEEHHPHRARPLISNSISEKHPIQWLIDYRASYAHPVNILFYVEIKDITLTPALRECFP